MISKHGICYDLTQSPYTITLNRIKYSFSSKLYKEKFAEKWAPNRLHVSDCLTARYDLLVAVEVWADIILYKTIEKRGFCITLEGGQTITCPDNLILHGDRASVND